MTMRSLCSTGLRSHQIFIQQIAFWVWPSRTFALRLCSQQTCSNGVMQSRHYGPKSAEGCFWCLTRSLPQRYKTVLMTKGASKVYLIKILLASTATDFKASLSIFMGSNSDFGVLLHGACLLRWAKTGRYRKASHNNQ